MEKAAQQDQQALPGHQALRVREAVPDPMVHRDPFDRMLVSQAIDEGMTIVTPDPMIKKYPIKLPHRTQ